MQSEIVIHTDDGTALPGVLTVPDGAPGPRPALVLVYEAFGMTAEMRRVAGDLARDGYVVLIPDLFARGATALCVASAMRTLARGHGRELDDLEAARRWLVDRPEVAGDRIGTIGFCLGGGFALLLAGTGRYKVSAPFYSSMRVPLRRSCPVVASYGARDLSSRGNAEALRENLDELGVPNDIVTYSEAGHSFYTRTPGFTGRLMKVAPVHGEYHAASAEDAHRRIVAFFGEHL